MAAPCITVDTTPWAAPLVAHGAHHHLPPTCNYFTRLPTYLKQVVVVVVVVRVLSFPPPPPPPRRQCPFTEGPPAAPVATAHVQEE